MPAAQIRIREADGKWVIRAGGAVLAETSHALELCEGDLLPVIYFPRDDVATAFLDATAQTTTCPHKGLASYYSIQTKSRVLENVVWSYEAPLEAVAPIRGYLAFSPAQVTIERQ